MLKTSFTCKRLTLGENEAMMYQDNTFRVHGMHIARHTPEDAKIVQRC